MLRRGAVPHDAGALLAIGVAGRPFVDGIQHARLLSRIAIGILALVVVNVAWPDRAITAVQARIEGAVGRAEAVTAGARRVGADAPRAGAWHAARPVARGA